MSASSKKKLRNELNADKLTQRQEYELKEAKKLKLYTGIFCVVLALIVVFAVGTLGYRAVTTTGVLQRNTVAATVGEHEINGVEMNYFYVDAINSFYSQYSYYISYFLDPTKPLDEQMADSTNGITWADYFVDSAVSNAAYVYALCDAAEAAGFTLPEADKSTVETNLINAQFQAVYSAGYADLDSYLVALYGPGSNEDTYREYLMNNALANAYYNYYSENVSISAEDVAAADAESGKTYNSYSYNYFYLPMSDYLPEGINADTATAEEKATAAGFAMENAQALVENPDVTNVKALDAAIAELKGDDTAASTDADDVRYDSVLSYAQEWITADERHVGDITFVERTAATADAEGNEVEEVVGYYVVMYTGASDNATPLKNVRHCLLKPEGGTYNQNTGLTDYTEEEWAAGLEAAQELYDSWKAGDATEESFAQMANENSHDKNGNVTDGGIYSDVVPGQTVTAFNDWCFDAFRASGDHALIKTEFGYHIMYFVGNSATTYREYMIREDLRAAAVDEWYSALLSAMTTEVKNTKYCNTSLILTPAN